MEPEIQRQQHLINRLRNAPAGLMDYRDWLQRVLEESNAREGSDILFRASFSFMEAHSEADLGAPGPLVHFLESFFPDYLDALCRSLDRAPTPHTFWMLRRALNASSLPPQTHDQLWQLVATIAGNPDCNQMVRQEAQSLLLHTRYT